MRSQFKAPLPVKVVTHFVAAALALLRPAAAGTAAVAQGATCWDDWGEAAEIVRREHLATVAEVAEGARAHMRGKLLRTRLCEADGVFTYHLVVRSPHGVLRPVTVDARQPFQEPTEKKD